MCVFGGYNITNAILNVFLLTAASYMRNNLLLSSWSSSDTRFIHALWSHIHVTLYECTVIIRFALRCFGQIQMFITNSSYFMIRYFQCTKITESEETRNQLFFFFSVSRKKATTIYYSHAYRLQDHNYIHNQNHCRKYKRSTLAGTLTKHMYNLFLNPSVYCLLFSVTLFKSCAYSIPNGFYSRRRIPVNLLSTVLITRNQRLKTCDFICKTP